MSRIPNDHGQKRLWVQAIRHEKWRPNKHLRLCGDHFMSGKLLLYIASSLAFNNLSGLFSG